MSKPTDFTVTEDELHKNCDAEDYHYRFNKVTGAFARWGRTPKDDPTMAPAPEIMDLEISTVCHGTGEPCRFCYKINGPKGERMSFETFEALFEKLPKTTTQIAFGIGDITGHDDMWRIFDHARANGVIPNVTINGFGLAPETLDRLAATMGAVAVSHYDDDLCYDAVKGLTDRGMTQVNIHQVVSRESYQDCIRMLEDSSSDPRLAKLNAIVFLMVKPKGRATRNYSGKLTAEEYAKLVRMALASKATAGFDSCSAPSFLKTTEKHPASKVFQMMSDHCESGLFSIYANVHGDVFPCSFTEGTEGWEDGLSILEADDFVEDIWRHPRMDAWRDRLFSSTADCDCEMKGTCRRCPVYDLDVCR